MFFPFFSLSFLFRIPGGVLMEMKIERERFGGAGFLKCRCCT